MQNALAEKYREAARVICKQGMFPLPVNDTTTAIIENVVGEAEDDLDLIIAFQDKASQTLEELGVSSGLSLKKIQRVANDLAKKGLIFNQPNSAGTMVYRILPLMLVGVLEYKFMGKLKGDNRERELAQLFQHLMEQVKEQVQADYDNMIPIFKSAPPVDRTVPTRVTEEGKPIRIIPVNRAMDVPDEVVLPSQSVEDIISKFDDIAVGHCFCRQRRALLGDPCDLNAPVENCFTFGKSARHTAAQGFSRMVDKEEALKIMKESEAAGLVHKAFHPGSNETRPENLETMARRSLPSHQLHVLSIQNRSGTLFRVRNLR